MLVNGAEHSAAGVRARSLTTPLGGVHKCAIAYRTPRKLRAIVNFTTALGHFRPEVVYVVDAGYSGIAAAAVHRAFEGIPVVLDTGDAILALARSMGTRGPVGIAATGALERFGYAVARRIVVRGSQHRDWLAEHGHHNVDVIPDGVDAAQFAPCDARELRRELGFGDVLTVGVLGSVTWNPRYAMAYGWELVEMLALLKELPVHGVLIGDGDGLPHLKRRAEELGVAGRITFLGRVAYDDLPRHLSAIDICISTQSNDLVGRVRTTGKLPLYMANGRFVLASDVGEASRVLPPEMRLSYSGVKDATWPARLAEAVRQLMEHPERLTLGETNRALAAKLFDYGVLAASFLSVVERAVQG